MELLAIHCTGRKPFCVEERRTLSATETIIFVQLCYSGSAHMLVPALHLPKGRT